MAEACPWYFSYCIDPWVKPGQAEVGDGISGAAVVVGIPSCGATTRCDGRDVGQGSLAEQLLMVVPGQVAVPERPIASVHLERDICN
eukprot:8073673-Pyramimonas_sp.AAC.1